jgi:tRNA-dihydrouridine synthase
MFLILDRDLVESSSDRTNRTVRPPGARTSSHPLSQSSKENHMSVQIGSSAPDFEAETSEDAIHFHDLISDRWPVLFSHPSDRQIPLSASL